MTNSKIIYVFDGSLEPNVLIGTLECHLVRGEEVYSFSYDRDYLANSNNHCFIDPYIYQFLGKQYHPSGSLFGIFTDSCPDRWGRLLIQRREKNNSRLLESDYLLLVSDYLRMGSLRYKLDLNGDYLMGGLSKDVPPLNRLSELENASLMLEDNFEEKWIDILFSPGSSLGGARPKSNVIDNDGDLWIAKFPSKSDLYDVSKWEMICHDLAKLCDIDVPDASLKTLSKYGSTYLSKRFDRNKEIRIPFISILSLLGKRDGDHGSYLEVASLIRKWSKDITKDLHELFKRIIFTILVNNTDNHLRNMGMIYQEGWSLSPMYDVNPHPYFSSFATDINNELSLSSLLSNSEYFLLKKDEAEEMINHLSSIINDNWIKIANKYSVNKEEIEMMNKVFERKK